MKTISTTIINLSEFRDIPYFSRYKINRDGVVINITNNNNIMKLKGKSFQLDHDNGNRTTRTIHGLMDMVWNEKGNWNDLYANSYDDCNERFSGHCGHILDAGQIKEHIDLWNVHF